MIDYFFLFHFGLKIGSKATFGDGRENIHQFNFSRSFNRMHWISLFESDFTSQKKKSLEQFCAVSSSEVEFKLVGKYFFLPGGFHKSLRFLLHIQGRNSCASCSFLNLKGTNNKTKRDVSGDHVGGQKMGLRDLIPNYFCVPKIGYTMYVRGSSSRRRC